MERLAEFVTEQQNPRNRLHVTRIEVELPAAALRDGVVYVDTPGLGSLATAAAAETWAYLPRCDLGMVLIDAISTLTPDDLATIHTLCEAGIPDSIVLSKADLLAPEDRERVREYVARNIRAELGCELPVHVISVKRGHEHLLETWLQAEIFPLYGRHRELARQSLDRKTRALRFAVAAALRVHLKRASKLPHMASTEVRALEADLRAAAGSVAEARTQCMEATDSLRGCLQQWIRAAARNIVESCENGPQAKACLEKAAAEDAVRIASSMTEAALRAWQVLAKIGDILNPENGAAPEDLSGIVRDMPRFDIGDLDIPLSASSRAGGFGRCWMVWRIERRLRSHAGTHLEEAAVIYARVLQAWVRKAFQELQDGFDRYADAYRAQLGRLTSSNPANHGEDESLLHDLAALDNSVAGEAVEIPGTIA
jgi:hypothetical protein